MEAEVERVREQAKRILSGQYAAPAEIWELVKKLKEWKIFGDARKLLARARLDSALNQNPKLRLKLCQEHALCTYKDVDLTAEFRFDRALEILREVEPLETTRDPETLGITGAIYKRKWETFAQKPDLERSLVYYLRGYHDGDSEDYGYTGINAAFVLDLLAFQEQAEARRGGANSDTAAARTQQARHIREHLLAKLPALAESENWLQTTWWFLVTVAEAYFGLARYNEALPWLRKAKALNVVEWEFEATASQLASLARLQAGEASSGDALAQSQPWKVIEEFLGDKAAGVRSAFIGKVGLALSGGGFRASLFHIGVLARLAELDVLRSVEFLSCVSGGSIIGAHYYLEVRKLLTEKEDSAVTREDYIEIVRRLERDFLAGVQRNIRMRVTANVLTNLKMAFNPNHSRSVTIGELYESELYSKVQDGEGGRPRYLNELFILPKGEEEGFQPKYHNWRRCAKAPILILNGTSLNTGHNWQFTASWMGEPPAGIDSQIDGNYRLRRMYYHDAPRGFRKVRLGHAVAASACVPGLFEPIAMETLYPSRVVRLVDGGVHDNQGTASLLENFCNVLLVSDASGQMETQNDPSSSSLGVPLRSNSILQARIRQAQYHDLDARRRSYLLRGLMFVHLKKDLDVDPVDWVNCDDPYDASDEARSRLRRGELTSYGIRKDVQRHLAAVRTDLDSFSDVEAWALMTSGYRMTQHEFPATITGFDEPAASITEPWRFLAVEPPMQRRKGIDAAHEHLMKLLGVSNVVAFKVWKLSPALRIARNIALVLAGLAYLALCWRLVSFDTVWHTIEFPQRYLGVFGLALAAIVAVLIIVRKLRFPGMRIGSAIVRTATGLGIGLVGWAAGRIHLAFFDPLYLRSGKVERLGLTQRQK